MEYKDKRIPEIDGLRGVAILIVIVWHYLNNQLVYSESFLSVNFKQLTSIFWSGVDLFFVLSGYLIGGILLKNKGKQNYFKTFYIRRFFRIFPLYYFFLILYALLFFSIPGLNKKIPDLFSNSLQQLPFYFYFQNFLMESKQSLGSGWQSITWSLAIEEQFYLLLPFLIFIIKKRFIIIPLTLILILAPFFRYLSSDNWFSMYLLFQCRMDSLITGVFIALIFENVILTEKLKGSKNLMYLIFVLFGAGMLAYSAGYQFIPGYLFYSWINFFYGMLILITVLFKENNLNRLLRNRMLGKIGIVSYGIYLSHLIINYLFIWILEKKGFVMVSDLQVVIIAIISFILTFIFSYTSYYLFENKLIKIGHKFSY